jgi:hypothetical protein
MHSIGAHLPGGCALCFAWQLGQKRGNYNRSYDDTDLAEL